MNRIPLISILVPCYNNQKFIYETLHSIFEQTYPNLEVIVGDDCSENFNAEELLLWITNHRTKNIQKIFLIENSVNVGTVANIEKLQKESKGEFYFSIAADDVLYDKYVIEKFVSEVNELGEIAEVLTAQTEMWDENLEYKLGDFISQNDIQLLKSGNTQTILEQVSYRCLIPASNFYRRTVLNKIGKLSEQYQLVEDWPTHLRLLRQNVKFHYVDMCSIKHRDGGISHGNTLHGKKTFLRYYCDILNLYPNEVQPYRTLFSDEGVERAQKYFVDRVRAYHTIHLPNYEKEEKNFVKSITDSEEKKMLKTIAPSPSQKTMMIYKNRRKKQFRDLIKKVALKLSRKEPIFVVLFFSMMFFIAASALVQLNDFLAKIIRYLLEVGGYFGIACFTMQIAINIFFKIRHRRYHLNDL